MRNLATPIGQFWIDDGSPEDTRIGVHGVTVVENQGPNSTYAWSLDQEEALFAAARLVGAELDLLVPGGWRVVPGAALPRLIAALEACAATASPSARKTPPRG